MNVTCSYRRQAAVHSTDLTWLLSPWPLCLRASQQRLPTAVQTILTGSYLSGLYIFIFIHHYTGSIPKSEIVGYRTCELNTIFWKRINRFYSKLAQVFTTSQPSYLNNLVSIQPPRSTRCSSVVTLSRPPIISSLKITDRSFRYASARLWNQLPDSFNQPRQSCLDSPPHSLVSSSLSSSPLSSSITPPLFHSRLKTHTFSTNPSHLNTSTLELPPPSWDRTGGKPFRFFSAHSLADCWWIIAILNKRVHKKLTNYSAYTAYNTENIQENEWLQKFTKT